MPCPIPPLRSDPIATYARRAREITYISCFLQVLRERLRQLDAEQVSTFTTMSSLARPAIFMTRVS